MNLTAETMDREAMPSLRRNRSVYMRAEVGHISVFKLAGPARSNRRASPTFHGERE